MKIVINNTKTKTNEAAELWKHLEAKWNTRNSSKQNLTSVRSKSRIENVDCEREENGSESLRNFHS